MKRYIDADLLRKEIESRMGDCDANSKNPNQLLWAELAALIPFIDSLQQEQQELPKIEIAEYYYHKGVYEGLSQGRADALKILDEFAKIKADPVIVIKQQEQPCDTCTNDKGCVTCKDGELWEGRPSEDLEEAAIDYADYARKRPKDYVISSVADYDHGCIDGFKAGAEWQAERLLKGSPMPEDTVIFQKGIEEGKRLMMEEAVEGYVNYYEDSGGILMAEAQVGCPYHNGDKVKIVIVKED